MAPTVLVVDDEPTVADKYVDVLCDAYTVRTAYSGEAATEQLDPDVEVVLLDRRMPGMSGEAVLDEIETRGINCQVAMVTGVDPGFDILEMPFDDYLAKPVSPAELQETVDHLLDRSQLDGLLQEYASLVSKQAVLEQEMSEPELAESSEFHRLTARIATLDDELQDQIEALGHKEVFDVVSGERRPGTAGDT